MIGNVCHLETCLDLNWDEGLETGTPADMRARIEATLPAGWFPYVSSFTGLSLAPILDGALTGAATALSFAYYLFQYARRQTRLASMDGGWLDLASYDLFNYGLLRQSNEADNPFRLRIIKEFLRVRNTRIGITNIVTDVTGRAPVLVEPWNPTDCGVYDEPNTISAGSPLAYDAAGAWGEDPFTVYTYGPDTGAGYGEQPMTHQSFVTAYRPIDGRMYSDAMLIAAVERVRAAGTIIWMKILDDQVDLVTDSGAYVMDESGDQLVSEQN